MRNPQGHLVKTSCVVSQSRSKICPSFFSLLCSHKHFSLLFICTWILWSTEQSVFPVSFSSQCPVHHKLGAQSLSPFQTRQLSHPSMQSRPQYELQISLFLISPNHEWASFYSERVTAQLLVLAAIQEPAICKNLVRTRVQRFDGLLDGCSERKDLHIQEKVIAS